MNSIKINEKISIALYLVAIVLLALGIYQKGAGIENRFIETSGWIALMVASVHMLFLSMAKRKSSAKSSDEE